MSVCKTVVSLIGRQEPHKERLSKIFYPASIDFISPKDKIAVEHALIKADVALFNQPCDLSELSTPRLKWLHVDQSGLDKMAKPHIVSQPFSITSSSGRSAPTLAEHAIYFMLSICFRADELKNSQVSGEWQFKGIQQRRGLFGKSVLIVGMGNTGEELARYCSTMGMKVSAFRRKNLPCTTEGVKTYSLASNDDFDRLVNDVDFIALASSLNNTSYRILNKRRLKAMKPGSSIVNVARGELVDEAALIKYLSKGHIAGYGSDVFSKEPLPSEHVFRKMKNVYVSPHTTPQVPDRMGRSIDIIEENYRRFLAGETMKNMLRKEDIFTKQNWISKLF